MESFARRHLLVIVVGLTGAKLLAYSALAIPSTLVASLCKWDCRWYLSIVLNGYDDAPHLVGGAWQANWAFFPLYPMIVRSIHWLIGLDPKIVSIIVSTACFVAFVMLGGRYRQVSRGEASPWDWLLLIFGWPFGFYFCAPYTEALFAVLATAALLALAVGRPLAAGVATAFLTATRPPGILLAAWISFDRFWQACSARTPAQALRILLPTIIAPLGLMAFMAFLYFHTGDPLAFLHIQSGWRQSARGPLAVLADAFMNIDADNLGFSPRYLLVWAVLGLAAAARLLVVRRFAEAWLCGMTVLMGLFSGSLLSMPRFIAANPIFLFVCADLLAAIRWSPLRIAVVLGMVILQMVFVYRWYYSALFLV